MLEPSPPRRITPACAGNTHGRRLDVLVIGDHPRLRGEYIPVLAPPPPAKGSPPLARGIPPIDPYRTKGGRITPACAGNTRLPERIEPGFWDHPRLRGEYTAISCRAACIRGSPPLARGIRLVDSCANVFFGITPACAGNTRMPLRKTLHWRDHPRLRGEYKNVPGLPTKTKGSPPLARGIRSVQWSNYCFAWDHPRLRGEYKDLKLDKEQTRGSPPLARGIPPCFPQRAPWSGDHPRLRGEYSKKPTAQTSGLGSPPLARGIQNFELNPERKLGITPACAGNTDSQPPESC